MVPQTGRVSSPLQSVKKLGVIFTIFISSYQVLAYSKTELVVLDMVKHVCSKWNATIVKLEGEEIRRFNHPKYGVILIRKMKKVKIT